MDFISHGIWSATIFHNRSRYWLAIIFGMLPDALAFMPYLLIRVVYQGISAIFVTPEAYPPWVLTIYNTTHSLVVAGIIFYLLLFLRKDIAVLFLAWPLHIVVDIPTHSADHFPTKFLFPLSHLHYDGVHWKNWYVFAGSWAVFLLCYGLYNLYQKHRATSLQKTN